MFVLRKRCGCVNAARGTETLAEKNYIKNDQTKQSALIHWQTKMESIKEHLWNISSNVSEIFMKKT